MGKVAFALVLLIVLAAIGGGLYLAYWKFPTPSTAVEKVLPDARFPK